LIGVNCSGFLARKDAGATSGAGHRFQTDTVLVRREGTRVTLERAEDWPTDYVGSFVGVPADFKRAP
jgi:hypothetical protein